MVPHTFETLLQVQAVRAQACRKDKQTLFKEWGSHGLQTHACLPQGGLLHACMRPHVYKYTVVATEGHYKLSMYS